MGAELESDMKKERWQKIKVAGKSRQMRAAMRGNQENVHNENERENTTHVSTGDPQGYNSTLGPSAGAPPGNGTLSDPPGARDAPPQSKIQHINRGLSSRLTTPLSSNMSETALTAPGSQTSRLTLQTAAQQPGPKHTALTNPKPSARLDDHADGVNTEHNLTARSEALALSPKDKGTGSVNQGMKENDSKQKHSDRYNTEDGMMKDNEAVDVKERELEHKQTSSDTDTQQPATYLPNSPDCDGCKAGELCECNKDPEARASVVNKGLPRTPRTDEAVWAAAALGFLLVLLALSVLHTRLYRHWRTTPSLYWHDPQQDYDSVAGRGSAQGPVTTALF